ncbi:MAG: ABC transporter substrate-binding protein [Firmicutes bacterium]|nr:ABC transporter substrate-binding protein [Bacillota bacterium]
MVAYRRWALLAVLLVILLAATSCGPKNSPGGNNNNNEPAGNDGGPQYGGYLKIIENAEGAQPIGVPWEVDTIDSKLQHPALESMAREDANGELHPVLATEWEVDKEANTMTFKLRKGVKFHDGTDFNAHAVAFVIQQQIDSGRLVGLRKDGPIEIVDDYTIRFHIEEFRNNHLNNIASYKIISPTAFEKNGIEWARANPVGTGPFKFVSMARGESIKFERFDDHWREGKPYLDGVEFLLIRDEITQQAAMRATGDEQVHVLSSFSAEQASQFEAEGFTVLKQAVGPISLIPDSKNPHSPLSNQKVREAIWYAIDREGVCAARGFGLWTPAYQMPNVGGLSYAEDVPDRKFDLEKAKQLMIEAGYPDGFDTKIIVMPGLVDRDAMVAVQSMLAKIGINVELEFPDSGGYANYRFNGWENGMLAQHTRSLALFNNTYQIYFREDTAVHFVSMARPKGFQQMIEESLKTPYQEPERGKAMTRALLNEFSTIPIYYVYETYITHPSVHDFGFGTWASGVIWTPETVWMEQK